MLLQSQAQTQCCHQSAFAFLWLTLGIHTVIVRFVCFGVCLFWNFNPSKAWNLNWWKKKSYFMLRLIPAPYHNSEGRSANSRNVRDSWLPVKFSVGGKYNIRFRISKISHCTVEIHKYLLIIKSNMNVIICCFSLKLSLNVVISQPSFFFGCHTHFKKKTFRYLWATL